MGWLEIYDIETNKECGIVGDSAFDLAGVTIEKLRKEMNELYMGEFGRLVTDIEFEHIIDFVNIPEEKQNELSRR